MGGPDPEIVLVSTSSDECIPVANLCNRLEYLSCSCASPASKKRKTKVLSRSLSNCTVADQDGRQSGTYVIVVGGCFAADYSCVIVPLLDRYDISAAEYWTL